MRTLSRLCGAEGRPLFGENSFRCRSPSGLLYQRAEQISSRYSDRLASLLHKSAEGSSSGSGSLALGWYRGQGFQALTATSVVLDVSPLFYLRSRGELLNHFRCPPARVERRGVLSFVSESRRGEDSSALRGELVTRVERYASPVSWVVYSSSSPHMAFASQERFDSSRTSATSMKFPSKCRGGPLE